MRDPQATSHRDQQKAPKPQEGAENGGLTRKAEGLDSIGTSFQVSSQPLLSQLREIVISIT
jgi:hypothetical protein